MNRGMTDYLSNVQNIKNNKYFFNKINSEC